MQLLASKFAQIATAIDTANAQILALQTQLSELQEHQQQLLSVEQACQSALAQVGTALSMLNHVDPAEIGTFKAAVEAQFGTDAIAFLEPAIPTPAETIEPEPIAPIAPESAVMPEVAPVIDIEATPAVDEPVISQSFGINLDTDNVEALLNKMSLADIRKLAKAKGTDAKGNRINIAARLKTLVTESDIWDATA